MRTAGGCCDSRNGENCGAAGLPWHAVQANAAGLNRRKETGRAATKLAVPPELSCFQRRAGMLLKKGSSPLPKNIATFFPAASLKRAQIIFAVSHEFLKPACSFLFRSNIQELHSQTLFHLKFSEESWACPGGRLDPHPDPPGGPSRLHRPLRSAAP